MPIKRKVPFANKALHQLSMFLVDSSSQPSIKDQQ